MLVVLLTWSFFLNKAKTSMHVKSGKYVSSQSATFYRKDSLLQNSQEPQWPLVY
jgi:hypothetical protein